MADKKRVKRNIKQLQRIKTWQLVVLLILTSLIAATFLRLNNVGMIERRTAVFAADKTGDKKQVKQNLYALQRYSSSHMNADTSVLYLETLYRNDVEKITKGAQSTSNITAEIVKKADAVCSKQFGGYSQGYVLCFRQEQKKLTVGGATPQELKLPSPELYRHTYFSPLWSPDFAGWTIVLSLILAVLIIARVLGLLILKLLLRKHYSSI